MSAETAIPTTDTAILSRLIRPEDGTLTPAAAEALLGICFDPDDLGRIQELVEKNRDDELTAAERTELENYRRVSFLLDLLHSKARRALKKKRAAGRGHEKVS